MLGNFSFGDYFKHEAIAWSWEFLTSPDWVGIDPDRLYPVRLRGRRRGVQHLARRDRHRPRSASTASARRTTSGSTAPAPAAPAPRYTTTAARNTAAASPTCTVGCDCDRYIEVWNNVFSQFNSDGHGHYTELAQKNIDTGMGLERLACVCQGVDSLFDVDTVMNITHKVSELTGAHYGESHRNDVSLRVITDHIRSATFLIGDGVLPSNEGRGYVLQPPAAAAPRATASSSA